MLKKYCNKVFFCQAQLRLGTVSKKKKKKLMEFSIKLAWWVLNDQVFYKKKSMVLKCFILHKKHFKANFFCHNDHP